MSTGRSATAPPPTAPGGDGASAATQALDELRKLLADGASERVGALEQRLDSTPLLARDVARVLAEAVALRPTEDRALASALLPSIEHALKSSVRRDPAILTDVIFPVIGPAIRRAVAAALTAMTDSINRVLENSMSPRSLGWRVEAWRSGRPFAEVALMRSLVWRVEQVFLIHGETGLLLAHASDRPGGTTDTGLVSGMLVAIQDFVRDTFGAERRDAVESLKVGECSVWVEAGPRAVLAAVIRGTPPAELRIRLAEVVESIEGRLHGELHTFQGDSAPFAAAIPEIEGCLKAEYGSPDRGRSRLVWALPALAVLALAVWGALHWRDARRFRAALARLEAEPGIVVVHAEKSRDRYRVTGLRDPLSAEPAAVLAANGFPPARVETRWESYLSFAPEFQRSRATAALSPPATVRLALDDGALRATGEAPHAWIADSRRIAAALPGIRYSDDAVVDTDARDLAALRQTIEGRRIPFARGSGALDDASQDQMRQIAGEVVRLLEAARRIDREVRIEVIGHADLTGNLGTNTALRRNRAEGVYEALRELGLDPGRLAVGAMDGEEPAAGDAGEPVATLRVRMAPAPAKGAR